MLDFLQSIDIQALNTLRSLALPHPEIARYFVKIFADLEVILVAILLVALWITGVIRKQKAAKITSLQVFYVVAFSFCVYLLLNSFFPVRPRPETVSAIAPMISHLPDNSFPSGHAIFASASTLAIFAFLKNKAFGWTFLVLGIIMCFARILAGVHFPGDILVGYLIGAIVAFVFTLFVAKIPENHGAFKLPIRIAAYLKL